MTISSRWARLLTLAPDLKQLLPAHNTARVDPGQLRKAADAVARVRSGAAQGTEESGNRLVFGVDGSTILTAKAMLDGKKGDPSSGGSGLTTWP